MNFKRKKPRTASRSSRGVFSSGNPGWWNILHHSRPRRRDNKRICRLIMHGGDAEGLTWPIGTRKPNYWFW